MISYDESLRDADRAVFNDDELKELGIYENVVKPKFNIKDTVNLMLSNDYKDRLRAEYLQLGYRILKSVKYAITGNFSEDNYDVSIYSQIGAMMEYLEDLECRMFLNDIDIIELKNMLKEV